ncbi:histidine kinase [Micromonospora sp. NPDC047074]|uniref:sensor histidine kinase n=1 Tax=Micromonospora sp. NPDC047074 TaxID=3154339 RepID=UPI0034026FF2
MDEPDSARPSTAGASTFPNLFDVLFASALAIVTLIAVVVGDPDTTGRALTWRDALVAAAIFGLVLLRRRWPPAVLALSTVLAVGHTAWTGSLGAAILATTVAAYTVATRTSRATAWLASAGVVVAVYAAIIIWSGEGLLGPSVGVVAWIGMAAAVGDATRSRRAYIAAVEERARRAEQTREDEARRRVVEERIRIARDLHDVVAHHIAVINVHAGLAGHTIRTRPDQAETSVRHVRQAAQTVLDELAMILSMLRQSGETDAPTDPVPGLARLGELLDSLAAAGLRVDLHQLGSARPLPEAVDQAAYRIVQEALTNAHKHGTGGTAELRIDYRPDTIVLDLGNPTSDLTAQPEKIGHGLTGMRERALAVGGALTAGAGAPHRFHVRAVLPAPTQPEGMS